MAHARKKVRFRQVRLFRRRRARHLQESCGIEAEPRGKNQPFRKREAIEAKDKIDSELGAAAVANLADVEAFRE